MNKGFLLLELALALVIMEIAMVVTLHLMNGISHVYTQAAQATSLIRLVQWVGEQDSWRRDDRNDGYEVVACQLPAENVPAGNDPFSWVMRHVAVNKVAVRSRHGTQVQPFEMMVVKDG
jgi:hypothetical protein